MKKYTARKLNLQFFAGEGGSGSSGAADNGDGDDGDEDAGDGDDNQKKSDKKRKMFTQEELDEAIKKRLAKERKREEKLKADKDAENKDADAEKDAEKKADATDSKVSALEAKLLCFEHDVAKESVSDVVALARAYVDDDTDFEEAIEKVIKKYPQFVNVKGSEKSKREKDDDEEDEDEDEDDKKSWGKRQSGKGKKMDGVEEAFKKRNPGITLD